jgi:hypothetical protein
MNPNNTRVLTVIKAADYAMSGFGPAGDDAEVFGLHILHPSSGCESGIIYVDVQGDPDCPVTIRVYIGLEDLDQDSTDHHLFREYHMQGDRGLVTTWAMILEFAARLEKCETVANMDRVLLKELGFERLT